MLPLFVLWKHSSYKKRKIFPEKSGLYYLLCCNRIYTAFFTLSVNLVTVIKWTNKWRFCIVWFNCLGTNLQDISKRNVCLGAKKSTKKLDIIAIYIVKLFWCTKNHIYIYILHYLHTHIIFRVCFCLWISMYKKHICIPKPFYNS